jgi:hypothetical protein
MYKNTALTVLGLIIIGAAGYVFLTKNELEKQVTSPESKEVTKTSNTPDSGTNKSPVISSFTGPVSISVGSYGTWTAKVVDQDNDKIRYVVRWGDESNPEDVTYPFNWPSLGFATEYYGTTYTHTYTRPGVYQARLYVVDDYDVNHVTDKSLIITVTK